MPYVGTFKGTYIPTAYTIQHENDACIRKKRNCGKCVCDRRNLARLSSHESFNFDTRPRYATSKNIAAVWSEL